MPQVLTTNAVIVCPHAGIGTSLPTVRKWSVNGGVVLLENDTGTLTCVSPYPCVGYQLRSMGLNASRIDGRRVILATDFNQTYTGLPLTIAETHSMIDNSTPAAIPVGQAAPALSPAMADVTKPLVIGTPPALTFVLSTGQPLTLNASFTLTAAHPLKWVLTLINEPERSNVDLTNSQPPGLTVDPSGGGWDTTSLTVTLTMTTVFTGGLMAGLHRFFMTGVSQRGLSGGFEIILTVLPS